MARTLSHDDGRAIDLLLDQNGQVAPVAGSFSVKSGKSNLKTRLRAADRMLRMLSHMPAAEPSPDLVQRTMQRIDDALHVSPAALRPNERYPGVNRPHA